MQTLTMQGEQLLVALDRAGVSAAVIDQAGNFAGCNRAFFLLSGYFPQDTATAGYTDYLHPDDVENYHHHIELLLEGELDNVVLDVRLRHFDGHYLWVRTSKYIASDVPENSVRIIVVIQDISIERERILEVGANTRRLERIIETQAMLAGGDLDLDKFLQSVVDSMLDVTPATGAGVELLETDVLVYRAASGSAIPSLGLRIDPTASLSGLCLRENRLLESADTRSDPRLDAGACQKVQAMSAIVAPLSSNARTAGVLKILSGIPAAFSRHDVQTIKLMAGLVSNALDLRWHFEQTRSLLEERSRAMEALQREVEIREVFQRHISDSENRLRSVLEGSLDAYVSMDHDGIITGWNAAATRIFGWSAEEVKGRRLMDVLIPGKSKSGHSAGLERYLQTRESVMLDRRVETEALTRDQGVLPVELAIRCVDVDGKPEFHAFLHDITLRKEKEELLRQMAHHDRLTGLPNRSLFEDRLEQALLRNHRNQDWLALMYLDIDHFKPVNDTLGHAVGDQLLQAFAERMTAALRASDTLSRRGGDEFTFIAEGLRSADNAAALASKIVSLAAEPYLLDDHEVRVSTSIGVALVNGECVLAADLLDQADKALYEAKKNGRNGYRIFSPQSDIAT